MPYRCRVSIAVLLLVISVSTGFALAQVGDVPAAEEPGAIGQTPPRLSLVDGQVSFWRAGAEEWMAAQVNTALTPGDELYTGSPGNLELQIGGRAYVRAWASTHLGIESLEQDYVQLKITTGYLSLDLRRLDPWRTVEVNTPNAAFTIEQAGYYRINVAERRTSFITRRGGRATVTPASGTAASIAPTEEVVVEGADGAQVWTYVAPELDVWDRWNYARTDALIDSLSSRYVPSGVYGIDDLDHYGSWRVVETYGPVWVPTGVAADWVPYSTGSWTWDPFYGWTWVDTSPWGWAPYHHGRWVHVSNVWAWAPGPIVVRPVYAPALVGFFGPRVGFSIGIAGPSLGWVALGWGEPIIPWWGPVGFIGVPRWGGWGGPRVVNNVVVSGTTVVHAHEVNVYRNAGVRHAVTAIPRDRFGRGPVPHARVTVDPGHVEPIRGKLDVAPARASLAPGQNRGAPPPEAARQRAVVATRPPEDPARWLKPQGIPGPARAPAASPRLVPAPPRGGGPASPPRPPFGASAIERQRSAPPPRPDRAQPPGSRPPAKAAAPRAQAPATPPTAGGQARPTPTAPRVQPGPSTPAPRAQAPTSRSRPLPGEPANRLSPGRSPQQPQAPGRAAPGRAAPPSGQGPSGDGHGGGRSGR
jgi:uncharacterized protein DUF6600